MAVSPDGTDDPEAGDGAPGTSGTGGAPLDLEVRVDTSFTPIYRFLRVLVHLVNRLVFRTTVSPQGRVPAEGPVIIAPVHRSFIDFFVASEVTDRKLHYMAKDSLWKNGLLARILPTVGAFPVHRESADREALRRAQQVLEAGEVLILFPEGERRTGPVVEDLHEGVAFLAARTGATVVPVGIGGSASVMPKGTKIPRPRHIHLEVGEAIAPPERSGSGRVPRSRIHQLTGELNTSLQRLYDRSVEFTGRY
jgi:1-acyl-sn-glycerol-3-phosphate acyltransferase